jgi:hypothetical protein
MLVEITRTVKTKETIEIELPYFYKYDLMLDQCDSVVYGKITENDHRTIRITYQGRNVMVEVEGRRTDWRQIECYLTDEHKSNAREYAKAKAIAAEEVQSS